MGHMALRRSPGFWTFALGITGGAAGFFGPMFLNPDAGQAPLLGLVVTGPGGALAGTLLGHVFRVLPFGDSVRGQALLLSCTLLGLGTLWFALPEAKRHELRERPGMVMGLVEYQR
jgi:hypothetical protein